MFVQCCLTDEIVHGNRRCSGRCGVISSPNGSCAGRPMGRCPVPDSPSSGRGDRVAAPWWGAARGLPVAPGWEAWSRAATNRMTLRSRHYDIAIDLRGDLAPHPVFLALGTRGARQQRPDGRPELLTRVWTHEPGLHQVEMNGAIVGLLGVQDTWRLELPVKTIPAPLERELQSASGPNGFVVFAFAATSPIATWPLEPCGDIGRTGHTPNWVSACLCGCSADREYAAQLRPKVRHAAGPNLAGKTRSKSLSPFFARAAACVTVDSGPMHSPPLPACPS